MAPEVVAKLDGGYSLSVDWFSLGVLLFEMRCGGFPALEQRALPIPPTASSSSSSSSRAAWPDDATRAAACAAIATAPGDAPAAPRPWALTPSSAAALLQAHVGAQDGAQEGAGDDARSFRDLVLALMKPCPAARLGHAHRRALLAHPFFAPVDWPAVDRAAAPPADPYFNPTLGFLDMFDAASQQHAADGHEAAFADF